MVERLGFNPGERLAHRERAHVGGIGNSPVQLAQKRSSVAFVVFPGVFTVQDDGHQRIAPARQNRRASSRECGRESLPPPRARPFASRRTQSDRSGNDRGKSRGSHGRSESSDRAGKGVHSAGALERAGQDAAIGRGPLETGLRRQTEHLVRDRTFRGPQTNWSARRTRVAIYSRAMRSCRLASCG